jgi:hypothetical protein
MLAVHVIHTIMHACRTSFEIHLMLNVMCFPFVLHAHIIIVNYEYTSSLFPPPNMVI